jgi:signal transduction histidine kinase
MSVQPLPTQFAPAQRTPTKRLLQQAAHLANIPLLRPLFDAIPDVILILNAERQVVFANQALISLAHGEKGAAAIGLRPGEVLDCVHANENESGCGTSSFCKNCGAVQATLSSLDGVEDVKECRVSLKNGDALDLQVFATPLTLDGQRYSFFVLKDISHEKRRRMLEHVFFHDILNSAGALRGLADVLIRAPLADKNEIAEDVCLVCDRLIDEIKSQKELLAAENNELIVEHSLIHSLQLLSELIQIYSSHKASYGRRICLDESSCDLVLISDRVLLRRVLGNMIKNALEACQVGQTVILGCREVKNQVEFWVHNPGNIPEEVRMQIFQRSFSTKGTGRGLGTYSIKLLGERYLRGKVSFTSSQIQGTRFRIRLPLE